MCLDYLFIYSRGDWWLKITTLKEFENYHEQTKYRWERALNDFEQVNIGRHHTDILSHNIDILASIHGNSFIKEMIDLETKAIENQRELLKEHGIIYFNSLGGCFFEEIKHNQFLRKQELIFPYFEEKDIRIKKWDNGTHYYAYIGDLQLKDGDILKWDTEEEAKTYAKKYIKKNI